VASLLLNVRREKYKWQKYFSIDLPERMFSLLERGVNGLKDVGQRYNRFEIGLKRTLDVRLSGIFQGIFPVATKCKFK
jgi:hypothetical protein